MLVSVGEYEAARCRSWCDRVPKVQVVKVIIQHRVRVARETLVESEGRLERSEVLGVHARRHEPESAIGVILDLDPDRLDIILVRVEAEDGQPRAQDLQLPFTTSVSAAQRLAKIALETVRQPITTEWTCKLAAYEIIAPDVIGVTWPTHGWLGIPFEVI